MTLHPLEERKYALLNFLLPLQDTRTLMDILPQHFRKKIIPTCETASEIGTANIQRKNFKVVL